MISLRALILVLFPIRCVRLRPHWRGLSAGGLPVIFPMPFPTDILPICNYKPNAYDAPHLFGLTPDERLRHHLVLGATGTGKTTFLLNQIVHDIHMGRGCAVIDPHGGLADAVLDYIPPHRSDDLIWLEPSDLSAAIAINMVENVDPDKRELIVSHIISALRGIFGDSWGLRMEWILFNSILAHTFIENVSILGVQKMLVNKPYRRNVVRHISDPLVRDFWLDEFDGFSDIDRQRYIAPIQNKLGPILSARPSRHLFGQVKSTVSMRYIMDHNKIFIAKLGKDRLGAEQSRLIGALLLTNFFIAALARADTPEDERSPFFLVADEATNFLTATIAEAAGEARKFGLGLTLATQTSVGSTGFPKDIRDALFGNVGTITSFTVGSEDAALLEKAYGEPKHFGTDAFVSLHPFEVLVKTRTYLYEGKTLSAESGNYGYRRTTLLANARQRYTRPLHEIEAKIARWQKRWSRRPMPHTRRTRA